MIVVMKTKWEYAETDSYEVLKEFGEDGWEAYAVTVKELSHDRDAVTYYLKRPKAE